uniref:CAZy families CE4 protein n=1 Tax=Strongyloides venezuelensis TaxID=75913 RepID=A0A0K0FY24_STRVS
MDMYYRNMLYFDTLYGLFDEVLPDSFNPKPTDIGVPLDSIYKNKEINGRQIMVCHDMKGGYLPQDR